MFLVDTNILSESTKPSPNSRIIAWMEANESLLRISTISLGEIHYGIERLARGRKQSDLRKWLRVLRATYTASILPVDGPVALRWGKLRATSERQGRKMPAVDSLLAATALQHKLTLVTVNTKDFHAPGLKVLNPQ
jgi:predicted nucleic acid-binding protein